MYRSVEDKKDTPRAEWTSNPASIIMEKRPDDEESSTEQHAGSIALGRGFDSAARHPKPNEKDLPSFGDMDPAEGDPANIVRGTI